MRHLRNGFYIGILLLMLLASACQMGTTTPVVQGPSGLEPTAVSTTLVQGPIGVAPACSPPVPSLSNINSFCANQNTAQGGLTYVGPASYNWAYTDNDYCDFTTLPKVTCAGPQNQKFQMEICQSCGLPQPQALGAFVCSAGYVSDGNGNCLDADPTDAANGINWVPCPAGSHYDNALQNCADDLTDKLASPCPADHPYYVPDFHYCLAKAYPVVYNCQTFPLQLGACDLQQNKKACAPKSCSPGYSWSAAKCACVCPSGHC